MKQPLPFPAVYAYWRAGRLSIVSSEFFSSISSSAETLYRRYPGWRMFKVYVASTTIAPSSTSTKTVVRGCYARSICNLLTEVNLRRDDAAVPAVGELDCTVDRSEQRPKR